ncbi:MAG: HPr(Ser) kinase/phosphatase [Acidobacteria bacterium]|nr:HPr(Ser) kinase/phosphatase [Acidobacteriota bacterium]MCZ6832603.1 HPr(Ser) kinase/phosphatase [Acidobacteriota bacterium]
MKHMEPYQPELTIGELVEGTREALDFEVLAGAAGMGRTISQPRVQKPGLALAGFMEYLHHGRVQILGNSEITFLREKPDQERAAIIHRLIAHDVSCFAITKGLQPPAELLRDAQEAGIPILRTRIVSSTAIYALGSFLEDQLAPVMQVHGVLLDILGVGTLILGASGIGKSECALDLIVRGHRLVSDDLVVLRRRGDVLAGTSPQLTRYHMELRGIGIINVRDIFGIAAVRRTKDVDLVVNLDIWKKDKVYDRLGIDDRSHELLGVSLDYVEMPVAPGRNLAVLVEVTARNQLLKRKGHNPARELARRLDRQLAEGGKLVTEEDE